MSRLLFISHRVPYPPDKGERVRAFHELKALSGHFRVTLAALAHDRADLAAAEPLRQLCDQVILAPAGGPVGLVRGALRSAVGRSVTEGYFHSRRLLRTLCAEAAGDPFDLVFAYSSSTLRYALAVPATARVMDLVDADSAKWADYANLSRWPKSLLFRREAIAVGRLERRAVERCDAVIVVSPREAETLGGSRDRVVVAGNGVDLDYFKPADRPAGPAGLVFTGTMSYRPNVDAVCWFVREVWPRLRRQAPDLTFTIVGRDPTADVRVLAAVPGVIVTGTVPDVRPFLAGATVVVCPLRIARGVQNKILEAMAMGRAVVTSPPALAGLNVTVGADLLQADAADQWCDQIALLLSDEACRMRLEQSARARVEREYSWDRQLEPLMSLCRRLAGVPAAAQPALAGSLEGATA